MKDVNSGLAHEIADVLHTRGIDVEPLTDEEYEQLQPFDWDVDKYLHQAAVKLRSQDVDTLHVVSVSNKRMPTGVEYRAKSLMECPQYLLESRGKEDEPISVSFKVKKKGLFGRGEVSGFEWQSDCRTKLERRIVEALNLDTSLGHTLISSGHTNLNAWLEEVGYIAINTSKSYTQIREVDEFLNSVNLIARRLKDFR